MAAATQYAECPVCGEVCALKVTGQFWKHPHRAPVPCAGSGVEATTKQLRARPEALREYRRSNPKATSVGS
jgi:hypothetical protein